MKDNKPDQNHREGGVDDALELLVRDGGIDLFPTDTRAEVERILAPGQALEPAARSRLVDAARRGVLARSAGRRPVERLLFDSRRAADRSIEDVAGGVGVGVDPTFLTNVERGDARITDLTAEFVASWIKTLDVDGLTAISALTISLAGTSSSSAYAANPEVDLDPEDEKFVAEVRAQLGLDNASTS